jgi:UPF0755 protein
MIDLKTWLSSGRNLRRAIFPSVLVFELSVFLFLLWIFWWPNTFSDPSVRILTVSRGTSFSAVVDSLDARGIIHSKFAMKVAGRILGWSKELKVGRYSFDSWISNYSMIRDLKDGTSRKMIAVSISEGVRMRAVARRFQSELGVVSARIMQYCTDSSEVLSFGVEGKTLEGYLLPDTYFFQWQTDEREIVERLVWTFKKFYHDSLVERQQELGWTTAQVLALASIVEGETQRDSERRIIAGVYHNRLKKRMRLEADPTIQYVLPGGPRRLLYRDLRIKSPYNTYLNYGLPPGPINNPGREAILATLYPAVHQYLFFVADGKGGHVFSKSYSEHKRAVRTYRRIRQEKRRQARLGGL